MKKTIKKQRVIAPYRICLFSQIGSTDIGMVCHAYIRFILILALISFLITRNYQLLQTVGISFLRWTKFL